MKNRSRSEIIASILEVVNGGEATKTRLLYRCFISYTQLKKYLPFLLANDLISRQQKTKRIPSYFVITEKGTHFLEIYHRINEMITII
jgi:predicted transcriptional regulator